MGRDLNECESTSYNTASKCPASVSPHALRRGYVTEALNAGQPKDVTADRVDMTHEDVSYSSLRRCARPLSLLAVGEHCITSFPICVKVTQKREQALLC